MPGPGLLAQLITGKFCDHLPLYRQEQVFRQRHGVHLPRQSLARWVELVADWLKPIYEQIRTGVLGDGYVQVNETPVDYLEQGNGKTPGCDVFFRWETSRAAVCLDHLIPVNFKGTLQCDGYSTYRAFAQARAGAIALAGCWAHVRRKFHDALEAAPKTAGWFLRQLQHLYRVEAELRATSRPGFVSGGPRPPKPTHCGPPRTRLGPTQEQRTASAPESFGPSHGLRSGPMDHVGRLPGRRPGEIDNNLVENAIRPTGLGKKNWPFVGEAQAGDRNAILYTVIENCRRRDLDPYAHLQNVLTPLPHDQSPNPRSDPSSLGQCRSDLQQEAAA